MFLVTYYLHPEEDRQPEPDLDSRQSAQELDKIVETANVFYSGVKDQAFGI